MLLWLHDLNPFLIRFTDGFGIRWYGLAYALGFVCGWYGLVQLAKRGFLLISPQRVGDLVMTCVIGVVVGGRLGYVFFYSPSLLWTFESKFPWWGLFAIHHGGMASHGGMAGVILAAWWFAAHYRDEQGRRVPGVTVFHLTDGLALVTPFGLLFGRIANFINGELLGKIVAMPGRPAPWWAVRFPQEVVEGHDSGSLLPVEQQAERLAAIRRIIAQVALPGDDFDSGYRRVLNAIQRGDHALAAQLEPFISARHPSQLYQAAAEGLVLGGALWALGARPRKPGVLGSMFLLVYAVLRILTEFWRLPDAHLAVQRWMGFSRGQWLSVLMIAGGLVYLWLSLRSKNPPLGGWRRSRPT